MRKPRRGKTIKKTTFVHNEVLHELWNIFNPDDFPDAVWFVDPPPLVARAGRSTRNKMSLRRRRQQIYAPKAARVRHAKASAEKMPYLVFWQAAVQKIRAAHPSWLRTKVARRAAEWFNEYAKKHPDDMRTVSVKTIMRNTIDFDPGSDRVPYGTFPDWSKLFFNSPRSK